MMDERLAITDEIRKTTLDGVSEKTINKYKVMFGVLDVDRSGSIDVQEIAQGFGIGDKKARALLLRYDTNHDGYLDFPEFCALMTTNSTGS